jgi:hypothetical protein
MHRALLLIAFLAASLAPSVALTDGPPFGWHLAGNHPENYSSGAEADGIAFLTSKTEATFVGFGTLMRSIPADDYAGKRVRFRASVRSEHLADWAGLWMRVDRGAKTVAFDNMQNRPIKGTSGWSTYQVVLDVPADATNISLGTLVSSSGEVWINRPSLEVVGHDVPTTTTIAKLNSH